MNTAALREMPSSLNDACRKLEQAADEIDKLRDIIRRSADMIDDAFSGYIPGSGSDEGWHKGKEQLLAELRANEQRGTE